MYRVLFISIALLFAMQVRGEVVEGLYAAVVPVADQSAGSLEQGAGEALAEVIIKVSGNESALQAPAVASALKSARGQVQQYVFARAPGPDGGLTARFEFDRDYVTDLITGAGLPLWTANRPRVLAWVAAEREGDRFYVNPAETPELANELGQAFTRRGIPLKFPLFDLGDAAAIALDEVWRMEDARALAASARYGVETVALGRVVESASGNWVGDWVFLIDGERYARSGDGDSAAAFFSRGAELVAGEMAARYAVAANPEQSGQLSLGISGVESFAEYAAIVKWLEGLELVREASLVGMDQGRAEFKVMAALDAARLAQLLELNPRLQPLDPESPDLEYQWQK